MRKFITVAAVLLTIFIGCRKPEKEQEPISKENILSDKAHIIDTAAISQSADNTVTLNKAGLTFTPAVGDILLASPAAHCPNGLISKIVSIADNGNAITCTTIPSDLNESFRQLFIDYVHEEDYEENTALKGGSVLGLTFPDGYELTAGFSLTGVLKLNIPEVQIKYSKRDGNLFPDTVIVRANINTNGSGLEMKADGSVAVPEKILHTFDHLPVIYVKVWVGPLPLVIPFKQELDINTLPLNISGKMKFSIQPQINASLGFAYLNGEWKNLSGFTIGSAADKPVKTDFEAEMTGSITFFTPVYTIGPLIYPDLKAYFKMPNTLTGKIQTAKPNYSIKYSAGITAGVEYKFWAGIEGNKSMDIPVYSTTIREGNFGCYDIGDTVMGGIVFYLDSTNCHGMVCAVNDQSAGMFFWNTNNCPGSGVMYYSPNWGWGDTTFNAGQANTDSIVHNSIFYLNLNNNAATLCKNYTAGGYNDWFLPSLGELAVIFANKDHIPNMASTSYFSSSILLPYDNVPCGSGWVLDFGSGAPTNYAGDLVPQNCRVRAVRKF